MDGFPPPSSTSPPTPILLFPSRCVYERDCKKKELYKYWENTFLSNSLITKIHFLCWVIIVCLSMRSQKGHRIFPASYRPHMVAWERK